MTTVHATCVAIDGLGILLRGPSGSGKSDLALRLIDGGAQLVSDDYTVLENRGGHLIATAPESIKGMLEVRGLGILPVPARPRVVIGLIIDLVTDASIERLPDPDTAIIDDAMPVPRVRIAPLEASAAAKVRMAARVHAPQETGT
jgi:serine kinase of HPr protein (carbohydrate metabolism regulator)